MKCEYCLSDNQSGERCEKCGAPLLKKEEVYKSEPFFYNGYICYWLEDRAADCVEFQFWLGMELIERIKLSRLALRELVPEMCTPMPFIWDLFLVAHGEKEALKWQEKNNKYPAQFEIRRIENPEKDRLHSMTLQELAMEFRQ